MPLPKELLQYSFIASQFFQIFKIKFNTMFNLAESIQKNLGYATLYKVDPNTQDIDGKEKSFGNNSLAQAGIPAVLSALFNYVLQPCGGNISLLPENVKWLTVIFGDRLNEITERIAGYAGTSVNSAKGELEHIVAEAVRLLKEHINVSDQASSLRAFCLEHKNDGVAYLPAALQTGAILGNNTLDDRTHKMDGPISGLMHLLEKQFNGDGKI
jgi:hypothetical protein